MNKDENQNLPFTITTPLSEETDLLLRRYLKLQIALKTWDLILKILIIFAIISSTIFSVTKIAPFFEKQLSLIQNISPLNYSEVNQNPNDSININDIIDQLNNN